MKVISFVNNKGGVGKTTSVINFAAVFGAMNKRILMIDMDPQGNLKLGLKVKTNNISIYDVLMGKASIESAINETFLPNVHMIQSCYSLITLHELPLEVLRILLNSLNYDFILIDSPPALGLLVGLVLFASDTVIIPLQCEYFALKGLIALLNMIKKMEQQLGKKIDEIKILPTMFDQRSRISREILKKISELLGDKVMQTPVPRNVKVVESNSAGEPIVLYDLTSLASKAYMNVAKEFLLYEDEACKVII